jgi:hypothetical protein
MWLEQLSAKQKFQYKILAVLFGGLLIYAPLAAVYSLPLWPAMMLELTVLGLHQSMVRSPFQWGMTPWLALLTLATLSGVQLPAALLLVGAVHPPILKKLWELYGWLPQKIQLAAISSFLLIVTHTIACGWLLIQPPDVALGVVEKYVWGVYWTVTTLATVGYGDIIPQSSGARFYAMGIMMVGVSSFAIFVSHFSRLLINRDSKLEAQKLKLRHLQELLMRYQVPFKLRHEAFMLYQHILSNKSAEDEERILGELPTSMRATLQIHMRVFAISKLEIFQGNSHECLETIAENLQERFYQAGERIVAQGEMGHEMFVVHHGEVDVWRDGVRLSSIAEGHVFGEAALIEQRPRSAQVVARKYCNILVLSNEAYLKIAQKYPRFKEKFEKIHSERKLSSAA